MWKTDIQILNKSDADKRYSKIGLVSVAYQQTNLRVLQFILRSNKWSK